MDTRQVRNQDKMRLRHARKLNMTAQERLKAFKRDIIHGPNFTCFSCEGCQFKNSVKIFGAKEILDLLEKLDISLRRKIVLKKKYPGNKLILCHNCLRVIKNGILPNIHISNGLQLDKVPAELELTDLEQ